MKRYTKRITLGFKLSTFDPWLTWVSDTECRNGDFETVSIPVTNRTVTGKLSPVPYLSNIRDRGVFDFERKKYTEGRIEIWITKEIRFPMNGISQLSPFFYTESSVSYF